MALVMLRHRNNHARSDLLHLVAGDPPKAQPAKPDPLGHG